jgi:hypothetical protein
MFERLSRDYGRPPIQYVRSAPRPCVAMRRFGLDTVQKRIGDVWIGSAAPSFDVCADKRLLHFFGLLFVKGNAIAFTRDPGGNELILRI